MAGFEFRYMLNGGNPVIKTFIMKDTETFTKGDMMNIETGELDLAVTSDVSLCGTFVGTENPENERDADHLRTPGKVAGTTAVTRVRAIISPDAVYSTADANARAAGALLDITGATGAQGLAASSGNEFVVVERKEQNADPTFVLITAPTHYLTKVQ